jgi:peroxiredoxin Q/BCP
MSSTPETALATGQGAPDFCAPTYTSGSIQRFCLKEQQGRAVVLYFYPKDDTPGCTTEAVDFQRLLSEFLALGVAVVGISRDDLKSHGKFCNKYQLTFPLLSDTEETICNAYGVLKEKLMFGKPTRGIERSTFLIDKEGKIAHIWHKVKAEGHAEAVLMLCKTL